MAPASVPAPALSRHGLEDPKPTRDKSYINSTEINILIGHGVLVALIVFVGLLALVAIAIGLTALIHPNIVSDLYQNGADGAPSSSISSSGGSLTVNVDGPSVPDTSSLSTGSKTYLIATSADLGPMEFM